VLEIPVAMPKLPIPTDSIAALGIKDPASVLAESYMAIILD
jgi:hypothetical protein